MAKSIASFLSNRAAVESWLDAEKKLIESRDAYFSHWGRGQHLGIVITGSNRSGEMHVAFDGGITRHVEDSNATKLMSGASRISDEAGFKVLYEEFREKVLGK